LSEILLRLKLTMAFRKIIIRENRAFGASKPGIIWPVTNPIIPIYIVIG